MNSKLKDSVAPKPDGEYRAEKDENGDLFMSGPGITWGLTQGKTYMGCGDDIRNVANLLTSLSTGVKEEKEFNQTLIDANEQYVAQSEADKKRIEELEAQCGIVVVYCKQRLRDIKFTEGSRASNAKECSLLEIVEAALDKRPIDSVEWQHMRSVVQSAWGARAQEDIKSLTAEVQGLRELVNLIDKAGFICDRPNQGCPPCEKIIPLMIELGLRQALDPQGDDSGDKQGGE